MNLYLLRHGIAVQRGTLGSSDPDRPLTPKGVRQLRRSTQAMGALKLSFDRIFSSSYRRAEQTAKIVAEAFKARKKLVLLESLAPDGEAKTLIEQLNRLRPKPESVLLVGHEPYLSGLISRLVSDGESFAVAMKKGGLCKLTIASLKHGRCATLEWLLTPRQMELMNQ